MSDFLLVIFSMMGLVYLAYFISMNDGDGNALPDKTLMGMRADQPSPRRKVSRRFRRHAPKAAEPDVNTRPRR